MPMVLPFVRTYCTAVVHLPTVSPAPGTCGSQVPDTEAAERRAAEARRMAREAREKAGGLSDEVARLEKVAHEAEAEAKAKAEELRRLQRERWTHAVQCGAHP